MQSFSSQGELVNHNRTALHLKADWSLPLLTGFRREMNYVIKNTSIYFQLHYLEATYPFLLEDSKLLATVRRTRP